MKITEDIRAMAAERPLEAEVAAKKSSRRWLRKPISNHDGRRQSMARLVAEGGRPRLHRPCLSKLLEIDDGPVRIASAYVTERQLLSGVPTRKIQLLTSLLPIDIASGATSPEALRSMIDSGAECRLLPGPQRLHAKVYIFGTKVALVTSANLTQRALDSNIEVGVELRDANVRDLIKWFDQLWGDARALTLEEVADLNRRAAPLRREYAKLKQKDKSIRKQATPADTAAERELGYDLLELFNTAERFFVCNTDRKHGVRTVTHGYWLEERMHERGYAAVWETFKYPNHMEQVEPGHAIFMYAKGVGIIAIGRAAAKYEVFGPDDPGRIRDVEEQRRFAVGRSKYNEREREWRVSVQWLDWRADEDAFRWKSGNWTFKEVSDDVELIKQIRQHFLSE